MELAKLHSKAVDYVKTGVPAEMEKKLQPKQYPHFMEKNAKKTYRSFKILGQMYDAVNRVHFRPDYEAPFDSRILKRYTLDREMLKKARHIKTQYDTALKRIMGQMEIRTEFEVLSAFVMSKPVVGTQFKQHETVRRETDALRQQFKDDCIEAAGGSREFKVLAPFVAAMYQITHEEVQIALYESRAPHVRKDGTQGYRQIKPESMPLISFPWLFDGILGRIARGSTEVEQQATTMGGQAKEASAARSMSMPNLNYEDLKEMEYARTSSGIVHRGQILRLFHHDDEDDTAIEEEEDDVQQQPRHNINQPVPTHGERRPVVDPNAGIRPSQELAAEPSPPKRPVQDIRNKVNNGPSATLREQPGKASKPLSGDSQSEQQDNAAITTATTGNSGTNGQSLSLPAPDEEDLISFDSPPKRKQQPVAADLASATLSLMDMDIGYTGYVPQSVSALSGSPTVTAMIHEMGDAKKEKNYGNDGDDDEDLEIEEVIIEKKTNASAFDDLAKLA